MMMWRVKDVVVSNGIIECHIEKLKVEMGSWTPNCLRLHIWLDVSTLHKLCLPPNRDDSCWSLFVRLHKFLFGEIRLSSFFKRVTSSHVALHQEVSKLLLLLVLVVLAVRGCVHLSLTSESQQSHNNLITSHKLRKSLKAHSSLGVQTTNFELWTLKLNFELSWRLQDFELRT